MSAREMPGALLDEQMRHDNQAERAKEEPSSRAWVIVTFQTKNKQISWYLIKNGAQLDHL